jgi:glucose/arabinose dehydrogenase
MGNTRWPAVIALAGAMSAAGGEAQTPGGVAMPTIPAGEDGLIAVRADNPTVRPEERQPTPARIAQLRAPAGFRVGVFAEGLEQPRVLRVAPNGDVYVAEREAGRVTLLRDTDGDGIADVRRVVASGLGEGLSGVHGLALRDGRLYMVTVRELFSAPIRSDGTLGEPERHIDDLPDGGQHPNRTIEFGPDGALYLSVGSTCNACPEPNPEHATLLRVDTNGWEREIVARGLRNTLAFGWHPTSGILYGLDHNSDGRGNDWPPEELNRIVADRHYGWPYCGGDRRVDWQVPSFAEDAEDRRTFCAGTEPPVLTYVAHAAPMQMAFGRGTAFPAEYRGDAFATMRGSWNRDPPVGYEVVRIRFDAEGRPTAMEPFVGGWLIEEGRAHFGRLMGLDVAADGSLLVGDDHHGVIYRIGYDG